MCNFQNILQTAKALKRQYLAAAESARHLPSLVLDKESPFSRLHHQLPGSHYHGRDETRCVSSNESGAPMRPPSPGRGAETTWGWSAQISFLFSDSPPPPPPRLFFFPLNFRAHRHTLLAEAARFLVVFRLSALPSVVRRSANLRQAPMSDFASLDWG